MDHQGISLNRRHLLGAAAGTAAAGVLGSWSSAASAHDGEDSRRAKDERSKGDLPLANIGLQLFTVRDLTAANELDIPGTFEMLADAGYAQIEIGGNHFGYTAAQLRAVADQYGLRVGGTHVPGGHVAFRTTPELMFSDAQALGLDRIGISTAAPDVPRTAAGYKALATELNGFGAAAKARGLRFYYHNHPNDFTLDGGKPIYDVLLAETDPRLVFFTMDIAWFVAGGQNPYAYLKANPWRYINFHVKDLKFDPAGPRVTPPGVAGEGRAFRLTDVGKGEIDFPAIFSATKNPGDHRYFVEHDDAPEDETPDATSPRPRNPAGSANTSWVSRKYLANVQLRKGRGGRDD